MSRKEKREYSEGKKNKIIIPIIIIVILAIAVGVALWMMKGKENTKTEQTDANNNDTQASEIEKNVKIYAGTDRPIAVMLDNNVDALPHAGINDAYMVYEIVVESDTRLMALFKNVNVDKIGPVRSSRHYFLDYVMENDAIYAHFGWSPQAQSDISKFSINNINGIYEDGGVSGIDNPNVGYWRDSSKAAPHNAFTSTERIKTLSEKKSYRTTSNQASILRYTTDEVNLDDGKSAIDVKIPYSSSYNVVEYKYNEETKRYTRYAKGKKQTDKNTGEDVTTKNVIVTFAENHNLPDTENKGRQELSNVGKLKGYYITNGKAIEITCEKTDRSSKTVYKDLQGNEINVNDGNTFVQIVPLNTNVTFGE